MGGGVTCTRILTENLPQCKLNFNLLILENINYKSTIEYHIYNTSIEICHVKHVHLLFKFSSAWLPPALVNGAYEFLAKGIRFEFVYAFLDFNLECIMTFMLKLS